MEIYPLATSLAPGTQSILVRFESTLPGIPLSETVWDNASGAFTDVKESQQIAPPELAVSKLVAGREKDQDFIRGLLRHRLARLETIRSRLAATTLPADRRELCLPRLERLAATAG